MRFALETVLSSSSSLLVATHSIRRARALAVSSCVLAVLLLSRGAGAHGQLPYVRQIQFQRGSSSSMLATAPGAGLFSTRDAGQSWSFVCAESFGLDSYSPGRTPSALLERGTLVVATGALGLRVSRDGGCDFTAPPAFPGGNVVDVTSPDGRSLYVLSFERFEAGNAIRVHVSLDEAQTFQVLGELHANELPTNLAVAPALPSTLYLFSRRGDNAAPVLRRSTDDGASWETRSLPFDARDSRVDSAVIDPSDARVLYIGWSGLEGSANTLWVTFDGADTWRSLVSSPAALAPIAYSPDGLQIAIGGVAMPVYVAPLSAIRRTGIEDWVPLTRSPVWSLAWSDAGLYAGMNGFAGDSGERAALGVWTQEAGAFSRVLDLCDVELLRCSSGSTALRCSDPPHLAIDLQSSSVCGSTVPPPDATPGPMPQPSPREDDDDTGCTLAARPGGRGSMASALLMLVGAARWLRARRRRDQDLQ